MQEFNGIWWDISEKKVPGKLVITNENKISLITYEKLSDTGLINGFANGQKITLVDVNLDRTDQYLMPEEYNKIEMKISEEIRYSTYTYIIQMVVLGNNYVRKGDIRINSLQLKYSNMDKWINCEIKKPTLQKEKSKIVMEFEKFPENRAKLNGFDIVISKPYYLAQSKYEMQINNEDNIIVENIKNKYIDTPQEIIRFIQAFLVLCMGDNINICEIRAIDYYNKKVKLVLGYGKSNYDNRSIIKNVIKYDDIKDNFEEILKKWYEIYFDNELLIANFLNLQMREDPLISEYSILVSSLDNLYLAITKQEKTNEHFVEIVKKILQETNFVFNLSEKEIQEMATKVKEIRKYFIHSNKTQRDMVNNNISIVLNIVNFFIEVIRIRLMIEIGIEKNKIENYYKNIEGLKKLQNNISNNINQELIREENDNTNVIKSLSPKERNEIAELNAILGTKYREVEYNLNNTKDLIEVVENITAEYIDYYNYWASLEEVLENFDQSLEVFNPEKWMKMLKGKEIGDELIDDTITSLYDVTENMEKLSFDAEERCKAIWSVLLLGDDKEAKEYFLGEEVKYSEEEVNIAIEKVIDNLYEIGHMNVVKEDCRNFANKIKEELERVKG